MSEHSDAPGPLPQWEEVAYGGPYETTDEHGAWWRLWAADEPPDTDPFPPGYRVAPCSNLAEVNWITAEHGLYHALDMAGLWIAANAVQADLGGAARQLGLDGED